MTRPLPATLDELVPALSTRSLRTLKSKGITSPEKLFSMKQLELLKLKGFGRGSLKDVLFTALQYGIEIPWSSTAEPKRQFDPPPPPTLKEDPTFPTKYPLPGQKAIRKITFLDVANFIVQEDDICVVDSIVKLCELKLKTLRR